jgi:hypothetical protein
MTDSNREYHGDHPDDELNRSPTAAEVLRGFLEDNAKPLIAFSALIGGGVLLIGYEPEVPRFWYVFLLSLAFVSPFGYLIGGKLKTLIVKPNDVWVVDLDARYSGGSLFCYPFKDFQELEVKDGEIDMASPNLAIAKNVHLDEQHCEGIWPASLSDRELLKERENIKVLRGYLEDQAKKGFTFETQFFSIIRGATRDTVLEVIETFEKGSLPDEGRNLHDHVQKALEDHGFDDPLEDELGDLDLDPEDAEYLKSMLPDNQADKGAPDYEQHNDD